MSWHGGWWKQRTRGITGDLSNCWHVLKRRAWGIEAPLAADQGGTKAKISPLDRHNERPGEVFITKNIKTLGAARGILHRIGFGDDRGIQVLGGDEAVSDHDCSDNNSANDNRQDDRPDDTGWCQQGCFGVLPRP